MSVLDEIQAETWHILVSMYTYQRLSESLPHCATRHAFFNNIIAINALAEMIVVRVARLADKNSKCRSIHMLLKRENIAKKTEEMQYAAQEFLFRSGPVVTIRHEQIAHMQPGTLSDYPVDPLPQVVITAVEALVNLIDTARGEEVSYKYRVGSQETIIDLRASLQRGCPVSV